MDFIAVPLGQLLFWIYNSIAFKNYGLAIIIFTLITRLAMLPMTIKQQKSTMDMQKLKPEMDRLKNKYKGDNKTYNEEVQKLYAEHGINPMGGCLPMLIQFPIMIVLYQVIMYPMKFLLSIDADAIKSILVGAENFLGVKGQQLSVINNINPDNIEQVREAAAQGATGMFQDPAIVEKVHSLLPDAFSKITDFQKGIWLGPINLGEIPTYNATKIFSNPKLYIPLFLLVVTAVVLTYLQQRIAMSKTKPKKEETSKGKKKSGNSKNNKNASSGSPDPNNAMLTYMGPVITLFFGFSLPAGVILYWTAGYVVGIFQQLYINKRFYGDKNSDDNEHQLKNKNDHRSNNDNKNNNDKDKVVEIDGEKDTNGGEDAQGSDR